MNRPWYYRSWFILPLMFICFPVGVALMWVGKRYPLWARNTITVFFGLVFIVILVGEDPEQKNDSQTNTATAQQLKPEKVEALFTPVYTIVEENDVSYLGVTRKQLRIKLPLGLTKDEVQKNIVTVIEDYLRDKHNIAALSVAAYRPNDSVDGAYTIAMAEFAPGGVWGDADKFTSYKNNKLVVEFAERYFNPTKNPLDLLNVGDEVTLKKGGKLYDNSSQWFDENVVTKINHETKATIIDKKVTPMGPTGDLIIYKVKTATHTGWVMKNDLAIQ